MNCLQPQKEDALQINSCRTIVRASMLFHLSVTVYDDKKHKPMGHILVLEHGLYLWDCSGALRTRVPSYF